MKYRTASFWPSTNDKPHGIIFGRYIEVYVLLVLRRYNIPQKLQRSIVTPLWGVTWAWMCGAVTIEPFGVSLRRGGRGGAMGFQSAQDGSWSCGAVSEVGNFGATNATVADIAKALGLGVLNRPVVDQTRLSGRFNLRLTWQPDNRRAPQRRGLVGDER